MVHDVLGDIYVTKKAVWNVEELEEWIFEDTKIFKVYIVGIS